MVEAVLLLKKKGVLCCLATNQEKYRLSYLVNQMNLGRIFQKIFASAEIGYKKPQKRFFTYIFNYLKHKIKGLKKEEILYWDDQEANVLAGRKFGFRAEIYTDFENFSKKMARI